MNELIIENLQINYENNCVIKDFNLTVNNGELLVIVGPSGCGKSTILSAISGLIEPKLGTISFNSKYLFSKKENINVPVEKRNIGFVFQNYALWPHMTAYNNISYPLKVKKLSKPCIKERVSKIINIVNLDGKENSYPNELSGGEKQRVALARAIAMNPSMLLLDEPLANLDANLKVQLMDEIKKIQENLGITMIYVTHDQSEAFEVADKIIIMNDGKIMQKGLPQEVYKYPKNFFVANFLGENNIFKADNFNKNCFCKHLCKKINSNHAVTIRPEDIIISETGSYSGKINKIKFKGYKYDYFVQSDTTNLIISSTDNNKFKIGEEIKFDIKRHHIINNEKGNN